MLDTSAYRVEPGRPLSLADVHSRYDGPLQKEEAEREFHLLKQRLIQQDELLYAGHRHALLVVFQGMDTSGKDSTIRRVFSGLDPSGMRVISFKAPTEVERDHDFLWRIHAATPQTGSMAIFNRSHYEDVLIVRVNGLLPQQRWRKRYDHINEFERLLSDEGVTIVKFYLHISKEYQKTRLERRLGRSDKHWKFNPDDLLTRERWKDYQKAYEDALTRCSTPHAPWYIVPAERRWFRNLLVAQILAETLEGLRMEYPKADYDPDTIRIR